MNNFQSDQQDAPNPNNGNGNGHQKIFSLKPAIDPDTLKILDARRNCLADERLNRSHKALFCEIIDRALNPSCYDSKGIVSVSDPVLAHEVFNVSVRSIYTWKYKLVAAGYVWLGHEYRSNMWPTTKYFLTCLHRPRQQGKTDAQGTYREGKQRPMPQQPGLGARRMTQNQPNLPLPGSRQAPPESKSEDLLKISGESGNNLPVRAEENCGSDPKEASGETRRKLRVRAEENCGSDPKKIAGESRRNLRVRAEADFQHLETQIRDLSQKESRGGAIPPDLAFETWIKGLDRMLPSQWNKLEFQFERQRAAAKSQAAKAELQRKLAAVRERIYGPAVNDLEEPKLKPSIVSAIAQRQPTPEELAAAKEFEAERARRKQKAA